MSPLSRHLPLLAVGLAALAFTHPVFAQTSAPSLMLLKQAMASTWSHHGLAAETDLHINVTGEGAGVTCRERIQILAVQPDKYRSVVTLIKPDGSQGVIYRIISDGSKVITYRPGLQEYAVQPARQFEQQAEDFPPLGLYVGALFFADKSFTTLFSAITPGNESQVAAILSGIDASVSSKRLSLDGSQYAVYTLYVPKDGWTYRFFVDPKTSALKRIEMTVVQVPITMMVVEYVRSSRPASPPPATFQVMPPQGTARVRDLPVSPFYDK